MHGQNTVLDPGESCQRGTILKVYFSWNDMWRSGKGKRGFRTPAEVGFASLDGVLGRGPATRQPGGKMSTIPVLSGVDIKYSGTTGLKRRKDAGCQRDAGKRRKRQDEVTTRRNEERKKRTLETRRAWRNESEMGRGPERGGHIQEKKNPVDEENVPIALGRERRKKGRSWGESGNRRGFLALTSLRGFKGIAHTE